MMERPIIFSGPMVKAILEGRKTMTRRVMKPQPKLTPSGLWNWKGFLAGRITHESGEIEIINEWKNEYPFQIGMKLWVRETWYCDNPETAQDIMIPNVGLYFKATEEHPEIFPHWKPSIFMPRWASRIKLEITGVWADRLQRISEEDAKAEGVDKQFRIVVMRPDGGKDYKIPNSYTGGFANLWNSINKKTPWDSNPWVWVISFKRIREGA